jgi:putative hydrolase of the HAD superfamily
LGYDKPDPRFFIETAIHSGFQPNECVMIGNMYEKDITGAKKAGMQTAFFNEKNLTGKFQDADVIFTRFDQLKAYLF